MKIWDNGFIREMTDEEIRNSKETEKLSETSPKETDETIIEEFIDRVANANSLSEVKAIAQDIKERMGK